MRQLSSDRKAVSTAVKRIRNVVSLPVAYPWRELRPEKGGPNQSVPLFVGAQDRLFHYTDLKTLYLILQSETFWARHVEFSNDKQERILGFDLLYSHYTNSKEKIPRVTDLPDGYMICLCDDDELLNMWRGYAHQQGVAIGLDLAGPASFALKHNQSFPTKCQCDKQFPSGPWCRGHRQQMEIEPIQVVYVDHDKPKKCAHQEGSQQEKHCSIQVERPTARPLNADAFIKAFNIEDGSEEPDARAVVRKQNFIPYVKFSAFKEEHEYRLLFSVEQGGKDQREVVGYDQTRGDHVNRPHIEVMCTARISNPPWSYILVDSRLKKVPNFETFLKREKTNGKPYKVIWFNKDPEQSLCNVFCYEKPWQDFDTGVIERSEVVPLSKDIIDKVRAWVADSDLDVKVWSENCWPIRSITVGPQENQKEVCKALQHYCLNTWYLHDVDVRRSQIPYRPPLTRHERTPS